MSGFFEETLHPHTRQNYAMSEVLFQVKTEYQDLIIFENPHFGRMLALDGVVQTTERDEFVYHEMMGHLPVMAHGDARQVLIIGGGDGGVLREVLKHPSVERATMVEIDPGVIDLCKKYLPSICADAFENPRANVVIGDGIKFVAETGDRFDVIIVDSTDPHGPGEVLFTPEFYASCKRCLTPRGIVMTQNGVVFMQPAEVTITYGRLAPLFPDVSFVLAAIPSYVGGFMTLGWACLDVATRRLDVATIAARFKASGITGLKYYSPEVHVAAFALPPFIQELMR